MEPWACRCPECCLRSCPGNTATWSEIKRQSNGPAQVSAPGPRANIMCYSCVQGPNINNNREPGQWQGSQSQSLGPPRKSDIQGQEQRYRFLFLPAGFCSGQQPFFIWPVVYTKIGPEENLCVVGAQRTESRKRHHQI